MDLLARCILWCAFICYNEVAAVDPEESSRRHRAEIDVAYAGVMEIVRWSGLELDADQRVDLKLFLVELQSMAADGSHGPMRAYVRDKVDTLMRNITAHGGDTPDPAKMIKGYPIMSEVEFGNIASMFLLMSHWFQHPMDAVAGIDASLQAYNLKKALTNKRYNIAEDVLISFIEKVTGPLLRPARQTSEGMRRRMMNDQDNEDTGEDYSDDDRKVGDGEDRPIDEMEEDADLERNNEDEVSAEQDRSKSTSREEDGEDIEDDKTTLSGEDKHNTDQQEENSSEGQQVASDSEPNDSTESVTTNEYPVVKKRNNRKKDTHLMRDGILRNKQRRLKNGKKLPRLPTIVYDEEGTGGGTRLSEGYEGYGSKYFLDTLPKIPAVEDEGFEIGSRRSMQPTTTHEGGIQEPDVASTNFDMDKHVPRILKKPHGYLDESQEIGNAQISLEPVFVLDDLNMALA